jgi:hypothetical protein
LAPRPRPLCGNSYIICSDQIVFLYSLNQPLARKSLINQRNAKQSPAVCWSSLNLGVPGARAKTIQPVSETEGLRRLPRSTLSGLLGIGACRPIAIWRGALLGCGGSGRGRLRWSEDESALRPHFRSLAEHGYRSGNEYCLQPSVRIRRHHPCISIASSNAAPRISKTREKLTDG